MLAKGLKASRHLRSTHARQEQSVVSTPKTSELLICMMRKIMAELSIQSWGDSRSDSILTVEGTAVVQGPHFVDWEAWHEQGAVSLAAVPVTTGSADSAVIGSLSLVSTCTAAFTE